jgi:hypothetical protein
VKGKPFPSSSSNGGISCGKLGMGPIAISEAEKSENKQCLYNMFGLRNKLVYQLLVTHFLFGL